MIEMGPKKNRDIRISAIQNDLEDSAALKDVDVRDATSMIAQIGAPDNMSTTKITTMRFGPKIMASTMPTLWSKRLRQTLFV
jgi:hypothetical protein